ncbi:signal peptidase II [Peptostreptococcus canis]|uniref:Lipoprotein signal peptidase n=1 Tax=Peptostreptococcus canis TaxID=1159213 RepID=A0ABR6TJQ6_9FIRM|nr:signal peptidase II [Peptostreptococcus canis]
MMYELLIVILVGIDQITKYVSQNMLQENSSISIIEGIFDLTYVENRGAAFGLFQNKQFIFVAIAILVTIVGIGYIHKVKNNKLSKISIAMIISGAIGNLIDRIRLGYVIDFFDFKFIWSYVFNFADVLVVLGTILLCICMFFEEKKNSLNGGK